MERQSQTTESDDYVNPIFQLTRSENSVSQTTESKNPGLTESETPNFQMADNTYLVLEPIRSNNFFHKTASKNPVFQIPDITNPISQVTESKNPVFQLTEDENLFFQTSENLVFPTTQSENCPPKQPLYETIDRNSSDKNGSSVTAGIPTASAPKQHVEVSKSLKLMFVLVWIAIAANFLLILGTVGALLHYHQQISELDGQIAPIMEELASNNTSGPPGPPGQPGVTGPPGPSGMTGVVYTRWGSSTCPNVTETQLVYSGYTAGTLFSHRGGGANYVCAPPEPQYGQFRAGNQSHGLLYGAEYGIPVQATSNLHNVPCAVCLATTRGAMHMFPARTTCPPSWTLEYTGWLMSDHHLHMRITYSCVDLSQEVLPETSEGVNGAFFFHVEVKCGGGLPCPPYVEEKEVLCVVCTK